MPYKDHEQKLIRMREWRKGKMAKGYGKWLYARRKLRFEDAERFRQALEHIIEHHTEDRYGDSAALAMQEIAKEALRESQEAEEALGPYEEGDNDDKS